MKNRAKCKLCQDIIESFHVHDYVTCSCGEIAVDGGQNYFKCSANNWQNFIRVDDEGNEIIPEVVETPLDTDLSDNIQPEKLGRKDLLDMLSEMAKSIENLPQNAMTMSVTNADMLAVLKLLDQIFKIDPS